MIGLRRDLDRLFDDAFRVPTTDTWAPAVDVQEDANALTFTVDLPGVPQEKLEVSMDKGILSIAGSRENARTDANGTNWLRAERTFGTFRRSFQLPKEADESQIEAAYQHGVLTVRVGKVAPVSPRKIEIRTA
jgi:HSP20 family protein